MTDGVRPVGGPGRVERRESERRTRERRARPGDQAPADQDAVLKTDADPARAAVPPSAEPGASAFVAQQMGQSGQKRGLRGGAPVLDAARSAYLEAEYSGKAERRPLIGQKTRTDI